MNFNVCLIDPPGYRFGHFLYDVLRYVARSIESNGHTCTVTHNTIEKRRINVLVGAHLIDSSQLLDELMESNAKYVVLQSEIVRGQTLNNDAAHDARFAQIVLPLLRSALAVWDSAESNLAPLAKLGVDASFLRFGFHPAMEELHFAAERDLDFFFYGSVTPRRRAVLERLTALGYRVATCFDEHALFRNDLMGRAEVLLTLRQSDEMSHLPQGRIIYAANNRVLTCGEGGLEQAGLEDCFVWTEGDVVELLRQTRARPDRRALADSFHDRLATRPMAAFMAPVLEKTCSRL